MPGSNANILTNPAVSASGEVSSLLIEKFNGKVHEQYLKGENLQAFFDMQEVTGTNMVSNKYLGDTQIQVLVPGQEPPATPTEYDKNALVIDTALIARNTVAQIHDVQSDIEGQKSKIAVSQVKQLKKFEDNMIVQQLLYGGTLNTETARTTPRVSGHGFSIHETISAAQAADPNNFLAAIEYVMEQQLEQEVELNEFVCLVPWAQFGVLADANKIASKEYEVASGVTMDGFVLKRWNIPIKPTNRFPRTAGSNLLSNAGNSNRYDVTAAMLNAAAVLFTMDALMLGRTLALQGDIFWDKKTKTWFIDSWFAEGCIPDRWEAIGLVTAGGSENTTVTTRGTRKAVPIIDLAA